MKKVIPMSQMTVAILLTASLFMGSAGGALTSYYYLQGGGGSNSAAKASNIVNLEENSATIDVVSQASPAVVSILISKEVGSFSNATGPNIFPFDDFFDGFGFRSPSLPSQPSNQGDTQLQQVGGGTGFIIRDNGLILTNKHVVSDEDAKYTVVMKDGEQYDAEVLGVDPINDLAIVKVDAKNLPIIRLGNSDSIQIGQTVIAIGYALGEFNNSVTRGVVSGIDRTIRAADGAGRSELIEEAIQTDAAINPGNSGGPLLNLSGEVIAINTAVSGEGQSIGFAIPVNIAKRAVESVEKYGEIVRPFLGIRYVLVDEGLVDEEDLGIDYGAYISADGDQDAVVKDSPAEKAGLQEGDIILEVNGERIDTSNSLIKVLGEYFPGDRVSLKIYRDRGERIVNVVLDKFE